MQDNSTDDMMELLVRYMDGELNPAEHDAVEKLLRENSTAKERFQNLIAAKEAIRSQGLKQKLESLHEQFYNEIQSEETKRKNAAKPTFGISVFMRIAAIFILVITGYGTYEYFTTTSESLFEDNFIAYQPPVKRGEQQINKIDSLYNVNEFSKVIEAVSAKQPKTQKDYFLAGQAYLQMNNANAAINAFENIEQLNKTAPDKYFVEETDYYLALAYIKAGNTDAAEKQLNKITSDKQHLFYSKAKQISKLKLMMLKWKQ